LTHLSSNCLINTEWQVTILVKVEKSFFKYFNTLMDPLTLLKIHVSISWVDFPLIQLVPLVFGDHEAKYLSFLATLSLQYLLSLLDILIPTLFWVVRMRTPHLISHVVYSFTVQCLKLGIFWSLPSACSNCIYRFGSTSHDMFV